MDKRLQVILENLEQNRLGLDDEFQFKCAGCGKCCKHREDILLTTRDLHNIAGELNLSMENAIERYCETYIGQDSRVPLVRLRPQGSDRVCPLLRDRRCIVHKAKPAVCTLYPLGRAIMRDKDGEDLSSGGISPIYFIQPVTCGSRTHTHTVRAWLDKFGIPAEDEFYAIWNETLFFLSGYFRGLEDKKTPSRVMDLLWGIAFDALYIAYDPDQDLLPQFRRNAASLKALLLNPEASVLAEPRPALTGA